jgi:hypothetical protein
MSFCARYLLEHLAEVAYEAKMRGQSFSTISLADLESVVEVLREIDKASDDQTAKEQKG